MAKKKNGENLHLSCDRLRFDSIVIILNALQHLGTRFWRRYIFHIEAQVFDFCIFKFDYNFVVDALSVIRCHFGNEGCYTRWCELDANQQTVISF